MRVRSIPLVVAALALAALVVPASVRPAWGAAQAVVTASFTFYPGDDDLDPPMALRMTEGSRLVMTNADAGFFHSLESAATDEAGQPLFSSGSPIGVGEWAVVAGTERLAPGSYRFMCGAHTAQMQGVLEVLPAA